MNIFVFRSRKASITTGVVDRTTEGLKMDVTDRLSPLTSGSTTFVGFPPNADPSSELEKYSEMDCDNTLAVRTSDTQPSTDHLSLLAANNNVGNIRRHTVGPGDVAHEQALVNPSIPINFKTGNDVGPQLPINLPMLENQPLHNFTIKDQHLLKPPTVMGASTYSINIIYFDLFTKEYQELLNIVLFKIQ